MSVIDVKPPEIDLLSGTCLSRSAGWQRYSSDITWTMRNPRG
jgi:hypothetical protein